MSHLATNRDFEDQLGAGAYALVGGLCFGRWRERPDMGSHDVSFATVLVLLGGWKDAMQLTNEGILEVGPALLDPCIGLLWSKPSSFGDDQLNSDLEIFRETVLEDGLTNGGFDEMDVVTGVGLHD